MTHTNPADTHAITTSNAAEGGAWCSHLPPATRSFGVSYDSLLASRDDEIERLQEELAKRDETIRAVRSELKREDDKLCHADEVIDNLRDKLATLQRLGDAMREMGASYLNCTNHTYLRSTGKIVRDKFNEALTAWQAASVPITAGIGLIGHRGGLPTSLDGSPSIIESFDALRAAGGDAWDQVEEVEGELERNETARQTAIPEQTKAEAEVERLRGEVERLNERLENRVKAAALVNDIELSLRMSIVDQGKLIARLEAENKHLINQRDQLKANYAASQAELADLRAKLEALVGAVDKHRSWSHLATWSNLLTAADAARQPKPTEAHT